MLSRQWLIAFIVFDLFMIALLALIIWLGDPSTAGLLAAAAFVVASQLWEMFRRRSPKTAAPAAASPAPIKE